MRWIPDTFYREQARYLRAGDVTRIEFGGEELAGSQPDGVVVVDDPKLIARFVLALREAQMPAPLTAPPDGVPQNPDYRFFITDGHIDLFLKPDAFLLTQLQDAIAGKKSSGPNALFGNSDKAKLFRLLLNDSIHGDNDTGKYLRFELSPRAPETCFGPRFWSALHTLPKYQAERIRRTVSAVKEQVVAFRCTPYETGSESDPAATDPAEVAAFVAALCQVNERIYYLDFSPHDRTVQKTPMETELELRDGRKIPLVLLPGWSPSNPKNNPEWLRTIFKFCRCLAVPITP